LHIIVKGELENGRRRSFIEVYSSARYMTMTGDIFRNAPISDCNELLNVLWQQMGGGSGGAKALNKGASDFSAGLVNALRSSPQSSVNSNVDAVAPADVGTPGMRPNAFKEGGLAAKGGHVAAKKPSQKAVKSGNSYANDKIPALLSEGEVVIPRDVMQSANPIRGAADFVAKTLSKRKR
jgi:hypothetical protein